MTFYFLIYLSNLFLLSSSQDFLNQTLNDVELFVAQVSAAAATEKKKKKKNKKGKLVTTGR